MGKILGIFMCFILFLIVCNVVDATIGKRHVFNQLTFETFLSSPLNVSTHFGTPLWLANELYLNDGIIHNPTEKHFLNIQVLRNNIQILKKESLACLSSSEPIKNDLYFRHIADIGWKRFYLKWYGPPDPLALKLCPETCKILENMPEVNLAMFSILMPQSRIKRHFGPARMCLRYHMGLFTPNDDNCFINIGGQKYSWRDEKDVMFDDTMIHYVENNTDKPRIILFLDIKRPQNKGLFNLVTDAQIKYLAPLTTRSNNKKEIIAKQLEKQ